MNRIARLSTLAALGLAASTGAVYAQPAQPEAPATKVVAESNLPDGWTVLDRAVEAGGGVDNIMKVKNFVAKGSFTMPAMGVNGTITRTQAAPNKMHMYIDLGGMGAVIQATNGKSAWMLQPGMQEPMVLEGEQAQEMIQNAGFYDRAAPRDEYESAEVVGVENVNDTPCYRLNLKSKAGKTTVAFYSVESGHQLKNMSRSNPASEAFDVVIELSDFREVDGLVHAFTLKQKVQSNEFTIQFESYEHDTEIDDSVFSPPAAEIPEGEI